MTDKCFIIQVVSCSLSWSYIKVKCTWKYNSWDEGDQFMTHTDILIWWSACGYLINVICLKSLTLMPKNKMCQKIKSDCFKTVHIKRGKHTPGWVLCLQQAWIVFVSLLNDSKSLTEKWSKRLRLVIKSLHASS